MKREREACVRSRRAGEVRACGCLSPFFFCQQDAFDKGKIEAEEGEVMIKGC